MTTSQPCLGRRQGSCRDRGSDPRGMATDIAFGIGVEAGEVFRALVHGDGRTRHRRLEAVRRLGIEGDGEKVERLNREDLPGAFGEQDVDGPFGVAQVRIEALPVLRHRP